MKKNHWNRKSRVRLSLKVETNEEQEGLGRWQMIGTSFGCWDFQTNQCRPHPVRGLKLLHEPSFCYLRTIIVFQYRLSVRLRHSFHIIHLIETHNLKGKYARNHSIFWKTVLINGSQIFKALSIFSATHWNSEIFSKSLVPIKQLKLGKTCTGKQIVIISWSTRCQTFQLFAHKG